MMTLFDFRDLTSKIVSAHVSNNPVAISDVPTLIEQVYRALSTLGNQPAAPVHERPAPAVSVRKSVTPDHIACLEDGAKLKMLKRHLATAHNLTPGEYRIRWDLPKDYPMVAPNYSAGRSRLAKAIGLGRRAAPTPAPEPEPVVKAAPAKHARTRKKKSA